MKIIQEPLNGLYLLQPKIWHDSRGWFYESFNYKVFSELNIPCTFLQDNRSYSTYGTLRGLHFQTGEFSQAKLVTCTQGEVLDVVVDLRKNSESFGKTFSVNLSSKNKLLMFVPRGFAHGFLVLSDFAEFYYKCDNYYNPSSESGIIFSDKDINIVWPIAEQDICLSDKDKKLQTFKQYCAKNN